VLAETAHLDGTGLDVLKTARSVVVGEGLSAIAAE